jgi:branched-chain amino acid aminotransferase
MVETFEVVEGAVRAAFTSDTMEAASARLPEGIYTTLRTYGGNRILRPEAHAERLAQTGASLTSKDVLAAIAGALQKRPATEARLRLTFSPPRLFVSTEPFSPLPEVLYAEGVSCITLGLHRDHPGAKDTRFISTAAAAYAQLPLGVHEGLMLGEDGAILEGLTSNVFFVVRGGLRTEDARALPGVTRSIVLEVASALFTVAKDPVHLQELGGIDECFLTSVSRGILPVVRINGGTIGEGRPGNATKALRTRFEAVVEREAVPAVP